MRTKFTFFSLFIITFFWSQTQLVLPKNELSPTKQAEDIISQYNNFTGKAEEKKEFLKPLEKLSKENKSPIWSTIYNGLAGNTEAELQDKINLKSNAFFKESLKKSEGHPELQFWAIVNYAYYMYHYRQLAQAMPLFITATNISNSCRPEYMILPGQSYRKIGYYMATVGDTHESIRLLSIAESYAPKNSSELASILDNIGLNYLKLENLNLAESYFIRTKNIAKANKDYIRFGKTLGNLAVLSAKKGEIDTAINLVQEDLHYSRLYEADQNTMYALTLLSQFYLKKGNLIDAKKTLKEAEIFAVSKDYFKVNELEILKIKLDIAKLEKDDISELAYRRKIDDLTHVLALLDGDDAIKKANLLAQKEKYLNKLNTTQAQYEKENLIKRAIIVIIVLLIVLIIFIIINNKRKLKAKQDAYENKLLKMYLEKINSEEHLKITDHTLASYKVYLQEKNIQIEKLQKNIEAIRQNGPLKIQKVKMEALLQSHLMTDENWSTFKKTFQQEYPIFYTMLLTEFEDLTESNIRLVTLMKLGLTNYEISSILCITIDAVKKAKQRLKKKLGEKYDIIFENYV